MIEQLISRLKRDPDFVISRDPEGKKPYLLRWWITPRNCYFNIYLHKFVGSDKETPHDHPWWSISLALKGQAKEDSFTGDEVTEKEIYPGRLIVRGPQYIHRIKIGYEPLWTLFITGPVVRGWGFWKDGEFIPWRDFCDPDDRGKPRQEVQG